MRTPCMQFGGGNGVGLLVELHAHLAHHVHVPALRTAASRRRRDNQRRSFETGQGFETPNTRLLRVPPIAH